MERVIGEWDTLRDLFYHGEVTDRNGSTIDTQNDETDRVDDEPIDQADPLVDRTEVLAQT